MFCKRKDIFIFDAWEAKREGMSPSIKCPSPPTFYFFSHLFSHLYFKLFSYTFCFSNAKGIITRRGGWAPRDSAKGVFRLICLSFIFDFNSISGIFGPSCSTFFEHELIFFSRALSVRHLCSTFQKWFDIVGIRITYLSCGYSFNPHIRVSYALFSFMGVVYIDFYPLVFSDWCFIHLRCCMVISIIYFNLVS